MSEYHETVGGYGYTQKQPVAPTQRAATALTAAELLKRIADELHWQSKAIANIRSHVRIIAWCVFFMFGFCVLAALVLLSGLLLPF